MSFPPAPTWRSESLMRHRWITTGFAGSDMSRMSRPRSPGVPGERRSPRRIWRATYTNGRDMSCSISMSAILSAPPRGRCETTVRLSLPRVSESVWAKSGELQESDTINRNAAASAPLVELALVPPSWSFFTATSPSGADTYRPIGSRTLHGWARGSRKCATEVAFTPAGNERGFPDRRSRNQANSFEKTSGQDRP